MAYKLLGAKENETPNETIVRCANNLVKAVIAAGYNLHQTDGMSGVHIDFYNHRPNEILIANLLSGWRVVGNCPLKISFKPSDNELVLDE